MSAHKRIDELAAMQDGWLDGDGKAPTKKAIALTRSFVDSIGGKFIYPSPNGGISIEGDAHGYCWVLCIGPRGAIDVFWIDDPRAASVQESGT